MIEADAIVGIAKFFTERLDWERFLSSWASACHSLSSSGPDNGERQSPSRVSAEPLWKAI